MIGLFIYLLKKLFVFVLPLCALLVSAVSFSNETIALKISLILVLYHLLLLLLSSIDVWEKFEPYLELPILILLFFSYNVLPSKLIDLYHVCFEWIFPLFIYLAESIQMIFFSIYLGRYLMSKAQKDESLDIPIKSFIITVSLFSYLLSMYILYLIYSSNDINILNASFLSSMGTLLLLLIPFMSAVEESMVSDVALITLSICLNWYSYFYSYDSDEIISLQNGLKLASTVITGSLLLLLLYSNRYSENEESDQVMFKSYKSRLSHILIVLGFTYLPLTYFGHFEDHILLKYLQVVVSLCVYAYTQLSSDQISKIKEHID
ncbi:hypothetical protein CYY_005303 [Polysphondylium violaceum]|uniref:Transmembrane protein n=1 Tax=Polysphondylium violaceum TaxID=133409 RepID=A0A8J4PTH5_9MYCE|nr:hypothetical protein CYY_005303 [Polysphondylium violaceum]